MNFLMRTTKSKFRILPRALCAICALLISSVAAAAQVGTLRVIVAGRDLPPTVQAERRGAQVLIPIVPIAAQLGYPAEVNYQNESIKVRRAGVEAEFIKQTGEVREGGVTITRVPNVIDIIFNPNQNALLVPLPVAAALLDVSIAVDADRNAVLIETRDLSNRATNAARGGFEIGRLDYSYSGSITGGNYFQNLNLNSSGRIGSNLFESNASFVGGGAGNALPAFYSGNFTLRRPQGDIFQAGDLRAGFVSPIRFQNAFVRGASYERPILSDKAWLGFYGGRSYSGAFDAERLREFAERDRINNTLVFDSNIFGSRFTYEPLAKQRASNAVVDRRLVFSAGAAIMDGKNFKTQSFDTMFQFGTDKLNVEAEFGAGSTRINQSSLRFGGGGVSQTSNDEDGGFGTGINVGASYTPRRFITLQGRFEKYSRNFYGLQIANGFNNRETASGSVSLRPSNRLSLGANAAVTENGSAIFLGNTNQNAAQNSVRTNSFGFNAGYDPSFKWLPRVSANVSVLDNPFFGRLLFGFVNLSREYDNIRPFLNYTTTHFRDTASHNVTIGAAIQSGRFGLFQAQQTIGLNRAQFLREEVECQIGLLPCSIDPRSRYEINNHSASVDWTPTRPIFKNWQVSVGGGYVSFNETARPQVRAGVSAPLFGEQTLQVLYNNTGFNSELRFTLAGPLNFWKPKSARAKTTQNEELLTNSTINGRIYLDENSNRQYDAEIDRPLTDARVMLDNGRTAISDQSGNYYFDNVEPGEHRLAVNVEDVRANLVPATGLDQQIVVMPRSVVSTAFRMVKSGIVSGQVWLDKNDNGQFDAGEGLTDLRVVSSSGRDTYTDLDGAFIISDLPPGEQTVFLDERYKPVDARFEQMILNIVIRSGEETKNVLFKAKLIPRETKELNFDGAPATSPTPDK